MRRRTAAALAASLLLASCATAPEAPPVRSAPLFSADGEWLTTGGNYDETHYSTLDQINSGNVGQLSLAWYADLATDRGQEATPLVVDGVLYNIEPWNIVTAFDGATGRKLWSYDPEVPLSTGRDACCDVVTRGLAFWEGKLVIATLDGRLIALNAANGTPLWSVQTVDRSKPYTVTGAPRIYDGKVIIGNAGAEKGVRGYVSAYDVNTGEMDWRFYTVPGNPALGPDGAASDGIYNMLAETWSGEYWTIGGGGTAWDGMNYDPDLGLLYIGAGNGSPWVHALRSPGGGDNLFLASIIALDLQTGEYRWHYQTTPADTWDYTATPPMILADLEIEGRMRQVLLSAPKNGFFYVLDRATGELLSADPIVPMNWASRIDMETGRPVENPEARYGTTPAMVSPGPGGAHNWNPMAFSPQTGLVYIPVTETYMAYAAQEGWQAGVHNPIGTSYSGYDDLRRQIAEYSDAHSRGWLAAWDPVARREVWRVPFDKKGSGGVLATAGNLVFQGNINTNFAAYDARTGEKLWEMPVQNVPIAAPITYTAGGEQYVAVNAGWGGGLAHVEAASFTSLFLGKPRLLVFKLGGTAHLPPPPPESRHLASLRPPEPPALTASAESVARGEALYGANCQLCHGTAARGGVKDLRHMSPETHAAFLDIVLRGARAANGMASFGDLISEPQANDIHAYLIARANADWQN